MFALRGWLLDYERAVAWGVADGLPEWGDWTERAKNGLFGIVPGWLYTMVASLVLSVPLSIAVALGAIGFTARVTGGGLEQPGPEFLVSLALMWVGMMLLVLVETAAVLPFAYVPEASYALYRDLGRALRFRTTWRQLRAGGPLLRRAWGFGAAYVAVVMVFVAGPLLPAIAAPVIAGSTGRGLNVTIILGSLAAWLVTYALLLVVAVPAALVQAHLWGEWAREAYRLEDSPDFRGPRADATAVPPEPAEGA